MLPGKDGWRKEIRIGGPRRQYSGKLQRFLCLCLRQCRKRRKILLSSRESDLRVSFWFWFWFYHNSNKRLKSLFLVFKNESLYETLKPMSPKRNAKAEICEDRELCYHPFIAKLSWEGWMPPTHCTQLSRCGSARLAPSKSSTSTATTRESAQAQLRNIQYRSLSRRVKKHVLEKEIGLLSSVQQCMDGSEVCDPRRFGISSNTSFLNFLV